MSRRETVTKWVCAHPTFDHGKIESVMLLNWEGSAVELAYKVTLAGFGWATGA